MGKKTAAECQALIDECISVPLYQPIKTIITEQDSTETKPCTTLPDVTEITEKSLLENTDAQFRFVKHGPRHLRVVPAAIDTRVRKALSLLAGMKEKVIQMRFGLFNGLPPMSHNQIADELTRSLTVAQRWVLARKQGVSPEKVNITIAEVQDLEAQALRDMRPKAAQFKISASRN